MGSTQGKKLSNIKGKKVQINALDPHEERAEGPSDLNWQERKKQKQKQKGTTSSKV